MTEQMMVAAVLLAALTLFIWGRWRYDLVALMSLLALCLLGVIPHDEAFSGFAHPAVITVAAVLIGSAALRNAGVVDVLGAWLVRMGDNPTLQVFVLTALVAVCSGFMNNVGALAILMPVSIHLARSAKRSPSYLLMPLAFGSLLGGMTTLIGTPPNIIIATFRANNGAEPFALFDFAFVGIGVALAGIVFIGLVGWRLIPDRQGEVSAESLFEIEQYTAELRVEEDTKAVGKSIKEIGKSIDAEIAIIGLARGKRRISMPPPYETLRPDDIILVEGDTEAIKALAEGMGLALEGDKELRDELMRSGDIEVIEAIVTPDSYIERRTVGQLNLRRRFGVNLLGVARQGHRLKRRLRDIRFRAGDVMLLQGDKQALAETLPALGCLPLAQRELQLGKPRRVLLAFGVFVATLATIVAGILPVQIAFSLCAVAMVLVGLLSLREMYRAVDWPVIVLLGAMLPVGRAMETSGGAQTIADALLAVSGSMPPVVTIGLLLIATMFLSDLVNNAAAAVLMAPIAIGLAHGMDASADPFLMAVAVGASCAFLTPIGHQSNTLVLGPGGYLFSDYWKLGLPLEILIVVVGLPLIMFFWPLYPA